MLCLSFVLIGRYCVAVVKPGRKERVCEALRLAYDKYNTVPGEIIPFYRFERKTWNIWLDCFSAEKLSESMEHIENSLNLKPMSKAQQMPLKISFNKQTRPATQSNKRSEDPPFPEKIMLQNGSEFEVEIFGDIELKSEQLGLNKENIFLRYHDKLKHNYMCVEVMPKEGCNTIGQPLKGYIRIFSNTRRDCKQCVRLYEVQIDYSKVEEYFYVEPEPEPIIIESEEPKLNEPEKVLDPVRPAKHHTVVQEKVRDKMASIESFKRLTKPVKPVSSGKPLSHSLYIIV